MNTSRIFIVALLALTALSVQAMQRVKCIQNIARTLKLNTKLLRRTRVLGLGVTAVDTPADSSSVQPGDLADQIRAEQVTETNNDFNTATYDHTPEPAPSSSCGSTCYNDTDTGPGHSWNDAEISNRSDNCSIQ